MTETDETPKLAGRLDGLVMHKIRTMAARQIGKEQVCVFCGAPYSFTDGESFRPEAVCADCWPHISEIEVKHARGA